MNDITVNERAWVNAAAEEYRREGYEVVREPLLDFAPGLRPDLLLRKDGEATIVEVKSRSTLAADPQTSELARLVESKPGWSLRLLLLGEPGALDAPDGLRSYELPDALRRLDAAERLLAEGHTEAAFSVAWSACEAALRALLIDDGVEEWKLTAPDAVFEQAVFLGVILGEDYHRLTELRKYRDAIVHGFRVDGFSAELVTELIATVRRIEAEQPFLDD